MGANMLVGENTAIAMTENRNSLKWRHHQEMEEKLYNPKRSANGKSPQTGGGDFIIRMPPDHTVFLPVLILALVLLSWAPN
jgi:hypothetical protein